MEIFVNKMPISIPENMTIESALFHLNLKEFHGIALALNGEFVPHNQWKNIFLQNGYDLIIIEATQGG